MELIRSANLCEHNKLLVTLPYNFPLPKIHTICTICEKESEAPARQSIFQKRGKEIMRKEECKEIERILKIPFYPIAGGDIATKYSSFLS